MSWPSKRMVPSRIDQPQDGLRRGRLAAAGLSDQREHLAGAARTRRRPPRARTLRPRGDRPNEPAGDGIACDQVVDLEERAGSVSGASLPRPPQPGRRSDGRRLVSGADWAQGRPLGRTGRRRGRSAAGTGSRRTRRSRRGGAPGIERTSLRAQSRSGVAAKSSRVYGCRGAWNRSSIGPVLDDLARVHDGGAVADLRHDREVVRDQDERQAQVVGEAPSSSRICACTITSSAVVGSSASRTFGLAGEGHRDRGALAHPARELVRVPGARARPGSRPSRAARPPARWRAAPSAIPCSSIGSTIWTPTVFTGLARSSPLEDHRDVLPAVRAHVVLAAGQDVLAVEQHLAPATLAVGGSSPMSARIVVVLPQPDSPTSPMRSPALERRS